MRALRAVRLGPFAPASGIPSGMVLPTAFASAAAVVFGIVQGWPVWAIVAVGAGLWLPALVFDIGWTRRHYGWLALFYVLVLTQGGHVVEHVVQVTQIHVLGTPPKDAHGVFGALDIEWVHFVWNTWVLLAVVVLVVRFRRNPWLWAALVFAAWHEIEHGYLIAKYLASGVPGHPGLGAMGGVVGLPIARPDLHFFYNVVETTPLIVGFVYQLRRTYDAWLAQAFPRLGPDALVSVSAGATARRLLPGEEVVREGDFPRSCFVVAAGELEVLRGRDETLVATLGPGQIFGEAGLVRHVPRTATVRARTRAEVLELDAVTLREILERSPETAKDLSRIVRQRS